MKKQWIVYVIITILLLGVTIHGHAASFDTAITRAADLAADYRTLADGVAPLGMDAGDTLIEARLPMGGVDEQALASIMNSLPAKADTAIVADRFHDSRWLHIVCSTDGDSIYGDALAIVSALPLSLNTVQLSLNVSWNTAMTYPAAEKKDMIQSILDDLGARIVASMSDGGIASASGYSPRLSGIAGTGADRMNITASLCPNPHGGSTLWLGTPVLTVEY